MGWSALMPTPFGAVGIRTEGDVLVELALLPGERQRITAGTALARETERQIAAYLANSRHRFDLPYRLDGTDHQCRVWQRIALIPAGETLSYKALAADIGSAPRAVGGACGRNPLPLIIPCHRVVAVSGIGGFNGAADERPGSLPIKRWLLNHEC